jgi:hypothetical protein
MVVCMTGIQAVLNQPKRDYIRLNNSAVYALYVLG